MILLTHRAVAHSQVMDSDEFRLVEQAINAKQSQHFIARQDNFLFGTVPNGTGVMKTRIVADVSRDGSRIRLAYQMPTAAAHRVVVDDGHLFQQWEPSRRLVLVDQSQEQSPSVQRRMLRLLHRNYHCLCLREQDINGFPCDLIAIRSRRPNGGSKRIWVDRIHHAILRVEDYDAAGQRCYLSLYETIRFVRHCDPSLFRLAGLGQVRYLPRLTRDVPSVGTVFHIAKMRGRFPAWLPPGYIMTGCALVSRPGAGHAAILRYGDGLQTFCVSEEASGIQGDPSGLAQHDHSAHYGQRVWEMTDSNIRLTIIGDAMLPDSLGRDLLRALLPTTDAVLRSCLARDFGPGALLAASTLRDQGWGYDEIVSLSLYLRRHPDKAHAAATCLKKGYGWTQIVSGFHAAAAPLDQKARAWIAKALDAHK